MCDWMDPAAGLLAPIVKARLMRMLLSEVIQTEETPFPVQDHDVRGMGDR